MNTFDDVVAHIRRLDPALGTITREQLVASIDDAVLAYDGASFWSDDSRRFLDTRHDIAEPLHRVITLLSSEGNRYQLCKDAGIEPERYHELLVDLDRLQRAVPPPPPPTARGRPSRTKDLRALVGALADYWETATGKRFTQDWHRGEPISKAAQFVHAIVSYVDAQATPKLPNVTEDIVADRKAPRRRQPQRSSQRPTPAHPSRPGKARRRER